MSNVVSNGFETVSIENGAVDRLVIEIENMEGMKLTVVADPNSLAVLDPKVENEYRDSVVYSRTRRGPSMAEMITEVI